MRHASEDTQETSASDVAVDYKSFSSRRDFLRILTWNVLTAKSCKKRRAITEYLKSCGDIIGIQEARLEGIGTLLLKDFVLHYYGVKGGQKGVGLLVRNELSHAVKDVTQITESEGRIMMVTFIDMTIVVAYAPTECGYTYEQKLSFYENLEKALSLCNKHFPVYVLGDFNARIGHGPSRLIGPYSVLKEEEANENGRLLKSFAMKHHLRFEHTFTASKQAKKSTWRKGISCVKYLKTKSGRNKGRIKVIANVNSKKGCPSHFYATLDHILASKRFAKNNMGCSTYGQFTRLSDHRPLLLKTKRSRIKFKKGPRPYIPPNYWDAECVKGVSEYVKSHKEEIIFDEHDINGSWFSLSQVVQDGVRVTPKFPDNNEVFIHGENSEHFSLDEWWARRAELIEEEIKKHNLRKVYQYVKVKYVKRTNTPKDFKEVVNKVKLPDIELPEFILHTAVNEVTEMDRLPTFEEVFAIIKKMYNGKACGLDGIPLELYKDKDVAKMLYDFLLIVWKKRKIPDQWRHSLLVAVPKSSPGEFRGINLLCSAYKIYAKVILMRTLESIMSFVGDEQNGFLPGRSTSDVIGCVRRLIEANIRYGSTVHIMLVDFSKAFDRISRKALRLILTDIGIDHRMVERIMDLVTNTVAVVKCAGEETQWDVNDGVRQGCPIGPLLFLVVLGFLMKAMRRRFPSSQDLEYADDLTVVDECLEVLDNYLTVLIEEEGPPLGLIVNKKKTEYIHVVDGIVQEQGVINNVKKPATRLLGTYMGENWVATLQRNLDKAHNSYLMLFHNLWSTSVCLRVKVRVFFAMCVSILLYGLESLPLSNYRMKKLDSFVFLKLREIFGYKYFQRVSYELLEDNCCQLGIVLKWPSEMLLSRRRKDYWHFFRHHTSYALLGVNSTMKVKSRVRTLDQIVCSEEGIKPADLHTLAKRPEATRQVGISKRLADIVKDIKNDEKLAKEQAKKEIVIRLQLEKEALKEVKRIENERKYQAFIHKQLELKLERDNLIANKIVIHLLGGQDHYATRLKELNATIIT